MRITCSTSNPVKCCHHTKCLCIFHTCLCSTQFVLTRFLFCHKSCDTGTVDLRIIECKMFRCHNTSVFFSCRNVGCCLIRCQNRIFRIILMVSCIVRCTVKVCSRTPEDRKVGPDRIISGYSSVLCSHFLAECLRDHCLIAHRSEFVIQILIIRLDHIRICGIGICICILSQCVGIKSVWSVILHRLRRHDRYD